MKRFILFTIVLTLSAQDIKIATYNIYFLDADIRAERKARLDRVISGLDADIIGFQEINDKAALKNILPDSYTIGLIDSPDDVQDLGIAVRAPYRLLTTRFAFPEAVNDDAFPRNRNLLVAEVAVGLDTLTVLVHHAKSRSGGRRQTDSRREAAAEMIVKFIQTELAGKSVILVGDMNDSPDDVSVNILEYGKRVGAGPDSVPDTFLFNTSESLLEQDMVSYGLNYSYAKTTLDRVSPIRPGARSENNKWRGKDYNFFRDVKIKDILFDQILVSLNLKGRVTQVGVYTGANAVRGKRSRIKFTGAGITYPIRGDFASDHVPVFAVISLN